MSIALSAGQNILELLEERLSPLRVGPAQQLLGLLPGQLEAVQSRADRLAAAHQPEPLADPADRSEEHTSELQSLAYLVCRLLLEKKKQPHTCDASSTLAEQNDGAFSRGLRRWVPGVWLIEKRPEG